MTWVRSHRWALIALVVLIPATVLAALSVVWFDYTDTHTQNPTPIPSGEAGTWVVTRPSDATPLAAPPTAKLSLTSYEVVSWDSDTGKDVGLLEGTEAVSAIIHVDARSLPDDSYSCYARLLAPSPEGDREWDTASSEIDYYPSGDLHANCDLSDGSEFEWEAVFVVPEGVGENARLVIRDGSPLPEYQLLLEH